LCGEERAYAEKNKLVQTIKSLCGVVIPYTKKNELMQIIKTFM